MAPDRNVRARLFLRMLVRSFVERPEWLAVGLLALTVATTLATALIILRTDVPRALAAELERSGPNLTILPAVGRDALDAATVRAVREELARVPGVRAAEMVAGSAIVGARGLPVVGIDPEGVRALYPRWAVDGTWPTAKAGDVLLTPNLAQALGVARGEIVSITRDDGGETDAPFAGVLRGGTGSGDELLTSVATAARVVGLGDGVSTVAARVPGSRADVTALAARLTARVPGIDAQAVARVAAMDDRVLRIVRALLAISLVIALVCATLTLTATLTTIVVEREQEIGVMRALGASATRIALIFASESFAVGVVAGVLGFVCGTLVAALVAREVFHAPSSGVHLGVGSLVSALGIVVALVASVIPVGRALRVQPAESLRGE